MYNVDIVNFAFRFVFTVFYLKLYIQDLENACYFHTIFVLFFPVYPLQWFNQLYSLHRKIFTIKNVRAIKYTSSWGV